jgi:hypothetical protein
MLKRTQSLIGAAVLICVLVIAATILLSVGRPNTPLSGMAAQPAPTDTPLPPLPVPVFVPPTLPPTPLLLPPPTPATPTPIPVETLAYMQSLPEVTPGTPLPGTPVAPMPTLEPTLTSQQATAWAITPSPWPTRFHITPSGMWRRYVDPSLGFSFVYPANWFVDTFAFPDYKFNIGYSIRVRNFDNVFKSYQYEAGEIKIEVVVFPDNAKPLAATSLISQAQHDAQQAGWTISELVDVSIAGTEGIRWIDGVKGSLKASCPTCSETRYEGACIRSLQGRPKATISKSSTGSL